MHCDGDNSDVRRASGDDESRSAVNSLILDYYKKFGRKRDLEQYFSLSTAQSDIRDPSSLFWAKMKADNESSDSGEKSDKKSESSQEVCKISIRFPAQDPCVSQEEDSKTKTDSVSPPIIIEELSQDSRHTSDDEAKSDDNNSQKSYDVILDASLNKPHSPSSSITSQRKLEWDSLADVGYANESDRKTSASSLSTLERLALKQQYSNNDTQQDCNVGLPTAQSTPLDENDNKMKSKKGVGKKSTKIYKKDVDFVEVNVPHSSNINPTQSINVNLTKHISFNVEKDGKVTVDNLQRDVYISPEKVSVETETSPKMRTDKEMQTSLTKVANTSTNIIENVPLQSSSQKIPILISLNTLRTHIRRKKVRMTKRKLKQKKRADKENIPVQEKSGEQLSEAESFEYMPGHIYNQNQMIANDRPSHAADNKSSLESSGVLTTDSSKGSKRSFAKDLEKSIEMLKMALQQRCDDSMLRKQLIKQVCQRLLSSKYRDDDSGTDFLSGLSYSSKKLGLGEKNNTTSSTSDANNSSEKPKKPKKSILRTDKFNPGSIASTSQSVPNLPIASNSEKLVTTYLAKNLTTSNTDSDMSSKEKTSSDNVFVKTSSEVLYNKYLEALKREQTYKKHLKDKEMFLKQKLVSSDGAFSVPVKAEAKPNKGLKDLMNDLTRNNYDDGSGDASKLEGGTGSISDFDRFLPNRNQRSHSVFTLSSENSLNKKSNLKKRVQSDLKHLSKPGTSKESHYCCCPHHSGNLRFTDSSVQVNLNNGCSVDTCHAKQKKREESKMESPRQIAKLISDDVTDDIKYVCLCSSNAIQKVPNDILIYKCSRLTNKGIQLEETLSHASDEVYIQCNNQINNKTTMNNFPTSKSLNNKSSQTNMLIKMLQEGLVDKRNDEMEADNVIVPQRSVSSMNEATRCIQTEISINPKISDPSLSDINIVSDVNCVKVISEHSRELPKPFVTKQSSENKAYMVDNITPAKCSSNNYSVAPKEVENELKEDRNKNGENNKPKMDHTENFTLPIHGTNMTLMVSIGSECRDGTTNEMVPQCLETDNITTIEQTTSLAEECSKGVQCDKIVVDSNTVYNPNPYQNIEESKFETYPKTSPVNKRKSLRRANTDLGHEIPDEINIESKDKNVDSCKKSYGNNMNHYNEKCPCGCKGIKEKSRKSCKECRIPVSDNRKELLAQRDFPDFQSEKCSCTYGSINEDCKKDCIEKQTLKPSTLIEKDMSIQMDRERDVLYDRSEQCSCGCGGAKVNCKKSCIDLKILSKNQCEIQSLDEKLPTQKQYEIQSEDAFTQKHISTNHYETCPCGCGGTKAKCRKSCKELNTSNKKQCVKQTLEPKATNQEDLLKQIEKCTCGCGGKKDTCKKSCKELQSTTSETESTLCVKKTIDKQIETETDLPLNQSETCLCKCGGKKDNCKEDCIELILKTRELNRKQSVDKAIYVAQESLEMHHEICSCGCGRLKYNCKNSCREVGTQKDNGSPRSSEESQMIKEPILNLQTPCVQSYAKDKQLKKPLKRVDSCGHHTDINSTDTGNKTSNDETEDKNTLSDPIINMIKNITKQYRKKEIEMGNRKKCFKEIMTVLNYLLETDEPNTKDQMNICDKTKTADDTDDSIKKIPEKATSEKVSKNLVDKAVQLSSNEAKTPRVTESSDLPTSTGTSSDTTTCKVLNKIKRECERYHQKRCKIHSGKKSDLASSSSMNCDQCRRMHHCSCRSHKCKCKSHKKSSENTQKNPIAYNLILQTSESMMSEGPLFCDNRPLKNIIVKVPKKNPSESIPFREMATKFEKRMQSATFNGARSSRSRSLPNESEISSMEEIIRKSQGATVREYLEKNRPDFIEKSSQRQNCMRYISESRALEREIKRDLLSMHFAQMPDVTGLDTDELRRLAKDLGRYMRQKQPAPKFINEREMKKHSEKIYKSLPEVVQKKEEKKKENIKKTNLLMANMFKRNLQKKTLRGSVNLSNYSTVIKI